VVNFCSFPLKTGEPSLQAYQNCTGRFHRYHVK
jgi:hypothetical protein